ncbi:MAG: sugar ABC transporter permease [Lachnospiraceae bacterium]|jgi:raffinose/stachyose/melibiose transport system permease protein|nr:sugar ABC transporter permease [Lachnospiraceae bacterium]
MKKTKKRDIGTIIGFLFPAVVLYSVFMILPLLMTCYYSFTEWNGITAKVFVGAANYADMLHDRKFWQTLQNTLILVTFSLIFQISFGLLIAYLLYIKTKGAKFFRTAYFLPVVIAPVAIGLMFSLFYNSEIGVFNKILESIGLGILKTNWLSNPKTILGAVMAPQIWQYIGLYITIFLGAFQSVSGDIVESAQIDGANKSQTFWHIIIPDIRNFVFISMILCITGSLKSFDHAWIMTKGGPGVRSAYLGVYMYKTSFVNSDFGYGSSLSIIIVVLSLIFSQVLSHINDRFADK